MPSGAAGAPGKRHREHTPPPPPPPPPPSTTSILGGSSSSTYRTLDGFLSDDDSCPIPLSRSMTRPSGMRQRQQAAARGATSDLLPTIFLLAGKWNSTYFLTARENPIKFRRDAIFLAHHGRNSADSLHTFHFSTTFTIYLSRFPK